jgi:hypothetical protein
VPLGAATAAADAAASDNAAANAPTHDRFDHLDPAVRPPAAWFAGRGCGDQPGPRNLPQDRSADRILRETRRPRIPRRDFDVTEFGGVGDGVTDNTKAIADAITAASHHGGGRVVLPAGRRTRPAPTATAA